MSLKKCLGIVGVLCITLQASAQTAVYKCGPASYSQHPCSRRIIDTSDAPVIRKFEQSRASDRYVRRLPGETLAEFKVRRHRAGLRPTDRDECERLDTRIPLEESRMKSPARDEVLSASSTLATVKKRFRDLKC